MHATVLTLEAEAQQVLDKLWSERLIPFTLNVGKITKAYGEYTIHFYDSRIHSARKPLTRDIRLVTWSDLLSWLAWPN